jgi:hypothetical protein
MIKNNNYSINPITFNSNSNNKNYSNIDNNFISTCDNNNNNNNIVSSYNNFDNNNYSIRTPYLNNNEFNKPNLIYNNISDKISVDILVEYVIMIESIDRDIEKFHNPFKYKIYFNPVAQTKDAYIYRTFENVKYIKLETAILPRKYSYFRKDITSLTKDYSTLINTNWKINDNFTLDISNNYTIIEDYIENNIRYIKYGITKPQPEIIDKVYELQYDISKSIQYDISNNYTIINDYIIDNIRYIKLGLIDIVYELQYDINKVEYDISKNIFTSLNSVNYTIIKDYIENNIRYIKSGLIDVVYELKYDISKIQYNINKNIFITLHEFQLIDLSLENEKFLLLNIDEIKDTNDMATNIEISNSFAILFPDYVNGDFFYTTTEGVDKIYRFSQLGNIKSLTVNITDNEGKDFNTQSYKMFTDSHISKNKKCICKVNSNGEIIRDYGCSCSYIRHPYYKKFQNTLLFKIGVIENDIDKSIIN